MISAGPNIDAISFVVQSEVELWSPKKATSCVLIANRDQKSPTCIESLVATIVPANEDLWCRARYSICDEVPFKDVWNLANEASSHAIEPASQARNTEMT